MRCRIYQWKMSRSLDDDEPLSPGLRRHLARCRTCRCRYDELTAMAESLRLAVGAEEPLSPELRERILSAVRPLRPARPRRPVVVRLIPAMAAAACLVLGAGFLVMLNPNCRDGPDPGRVAGKQPKPSPPEAPRVPLAALAADALIGESLAQAGIFAAAPLTNEVRLLASDTRAIGSALLACLPLELVGARDGWFDALLPGLPPSRTSGRSPTSHPNTGPNG